MNTSPDLDPPVSSHAPAIERPDLSRRAWRSAVLYVMTAAVVLRFYDLPLKPLHHDEGVNAFFLTRLVRPPHDYQYNPGNYHGPTLYYFAWASVTLLGLTTVAIRAVTASAGLLAIALVLLLRKQMGAIGALAAATLLALSPGAVYLSRYFIHEMLLVTGTLATIVAFVMWRERGRAVYLYAAAASAALMFATKETSMISAVVLVAAYVGAELACALREDWQRTLPAASRFERFAAVVRTRATTLARPALTRRGLGLGVQTLAVFGAVNLLFYTSFFTHWRGALDALKALAIWTKTGTAAHTRPWYTYLQWLAAAELPLLILGFAGAIWALWRAESRLAVFTALWAFGILAAYSVIPYKTPWLTLNAIAPLAICGGYAVRALWTRPWAPRRPAAFAVAIAVVTAITFQSVVLNFFEYDNNRRPYVYAHTYRDVFDLVRAIARIEELNPGAAIAVTSRDQFPLSWYLRAYRVAYYGRPVATTEGLVIASEWQPSPDATFGSRYARFGSYRLRPGVHLALYVRRDLRRPVDGATSGQPSDRP